MSKDLWFDEFERLLAENDVDASDDDGWERCADEAWSNIRDRAADQADLARLAEDEAR